MHTRGRLLLVALCLTGVAVATSGCEQARSALGMVKQSPDEFAVVPHAPLTMPPDYGLRPPTPGEDRPDGQNPRAQARRILLSNAGAGGDAAAQAVAEGKFSKGEAALLSKAGALDPDPRIRQEVDSESSALVEANKGMFNKLLFWRKPKPPGTVVDAAKEAQRLREASALGEPANVGDDGKLPVIERKASGNTSSKASGNGSSWMDLFKKYSADESGWQM